SESSSPGLLLSWLRRLLRRLLRRCLSGNRRTIVGVIGGLFLVQTSGLLRDPRIALVRLFWRFMWNVEDERLIVNLFSVDGMLNVRPVDRVVRILLAGRYERGIDNLGLVTNEHGVALPRGCIEELVNFRIVGLRRV